LPGSEEFMMAYQAALAAMPKPVEIGESRTQPGTVNALVVAYYQTAEWTALDRETQKTRKRIIEKFRTAHGHKRVALLQGDHIETMMAAISNLYARRHWLKAIRGLLKAAVPTMRKDDPTKGIAMPKLPKSKGHHTWTDAEIEQYRAYWHLGTQQRLVMEFALEAVSRRCEVVRLGPQHVRDGRIRIERQHGSADVDIPLTPELQAACEAMPKEHLTHIVTAYGKPRSVAGLGNDFARWATDAKLPKRCRLHGLKKGGMRRLAEAGNTTHELMAISGHRTLSEVQRYTADADWKKLADSGMKKKVAGKNENAEVSNLPVPARQTTV
jgi:Phage integrase family